MAKSWSQLQTELVEKAVRDPDFLQLLLKDPLAAAEQHAGEKMPDGAKLKVIIADPDTGYVVLPPPLPQSGELSDAALESVAGGTYVSTYTTSCYSTGSYGGTTTSPATTTSICSTSYYYFNHIESVLPTRF